MPVWHASVARVVPGRTLFFDELTPKYISKATRMCRQMLQGVGDGKGIRFRVGDGKGIRFRSLGGMSFAVHLQKPLTDAECGLLPDGWMEIPAVDTLGPIEEF